MTFEDYWQQLADKAPDLTRGEAKIKLSTPEFKRQLRKAFEAGRDSADSGDLFAALNKLKGN